VAVVLGGAAREKLHLSGYHIHKTVQIYVEVLTNSSILEKQTSDSSKTMSISY
jgi:hypothetical protein